MLRDFGVAHFVPSDQRAMAFSTQLNPGVRTNDRAAAKTCTRVVERNVSPGTIVLPGAPTGIFGSHVAFWSVGRFGRGTSAKARVPSFNRCTRGVHRTRPDDKPLPR